MRPSPSGATTLDPSERSGGSAGVAVLALRTALLEVRSFLAQLSDADYSARPPGPFDSSVGGHVRHCLDHVSAFLRGLPIGIIDYDSRERGGPVETIRGAALAALDDLDRELGAGAGLPLQHDLDVVALASERGPSIRTRSSVGRELAFLLSHTIHHNAMLANIAHSLGAALPPRFGYAPATLAHLDAQPCAQ
jgi:hypothetical protein